MAPPQYLIIPNRYEDKSSSAAESISLLNEYYSEFMKPNFAVRKSEDINISGKLSKPLAFFCKRNSIALEDVLEIIQFILGKTTKKQKEQNSG